MEQTTPKRTVRVIPVTKSPAASAKKNVILRVAAYCRVSTDTEEQINSYEAQKAYYTQLIEENPEWEMAGVFAEAGVIIGLNTAKPLRHIGLRCFGSILQLFREKLPARTLQEAGWAFQNKEIGFVMQFDVKVILI